MCLVYPSQKLLFTNCLIVSNLFRWNKKMCEKKKRAAHMNLLIKWSEMRFFLFTTFCFRYVCTCLIFILVAMCWKKMVKNADMTFVAWLIFVIYLIIRLNAKIDMHSNDHFFFFSIWILWNAKVTVWIILFLYDEIYL